MDYEKLSLEVDTNFSDSALSDNAIADEINEKKFTAVRPRFITARTVLAELGAEVGSKVLDKLEAIAPVSSPVKWMMKFLSSDGGVDIGNDQTLASIDALVAGGVLTTEEGQALHGMALQPVSRGEVLGIGTVSYDDVNRARALEVEI